MRIFGEVDSMVDRFVEERFAANREANFEWRTAPWWCRGNFGSKVDYSTYSELQSTDHWFNQVSTERKKKEISQYLVLMFRNVLRVFICGLWSKHVDSSRTIISRTIGREQRRLANSVWPGDWLVWRLSWRQQLKKEVKPTNSQRWPILDRQDSLNYIIWIPFGGFYSPADHPGSRVE